MLLLVEREADGSLSSASMTLGEPRTVEPANDPAAAYPPGVDEDSAGASVYQFWHGFEFPAHALRETREGLQAEFYTGDLFGDWCAMQVPYPVSRACSCDLSGCVPSPTPAQTLQVVIDGDTMEGLLSRGAYAVDELRLERQP